MLVKQRDLSSEIETLLDFETVSPMASSKSTEFAWVKPKEMS